jgi:hypothetical protein
MTTTGLKSILNRILPQGNGKVVVAEDVASIQRTGKDLAYCVVDHYTNGMTSAVAADRRVPSCSKTLLRIVDHMSERHNILFSSIVRRLDVTRDNIRPVFYNVVDEMFSDSQYNWGRVITVYAFAGWLAQYCCCSSSTADASLAVVRSNQEFAIKIAECAGGYVAERLSAWVSKQGGWDVIDQFFAEREDPEGALWHGLLYTFVGLGALATMAAVR